MRYTKFLLIFFVSISFFFLINVPAHAQLPDQLDGKEGYIRGVVMQVLHAGTQSVGEVKSYSETLTVKLEEGNEKGKTITIGYSTSALFSTEQKIYQGDTVIIDSKPDGQRNITYSVYDKYRLPHLWWILGAFILLILLIARKKGIGALIGLIISIVTVIGYIIPNILNGHDPLQTCFWGALLILFLSTYITHGISLKTTAAVMGTAFSLIITLGISIVSIKFLGIFGLGNQDLYDLQIGTNHPIQPQGLLLGSIIIGTLGALNDITTTQSITIFTLAKDNSKQRISHLFSKSMHIGREHIASLINTLVLAYAGSSFAIFIFLALNPVKLPWWIILNDETIMEEIVRTVMGSSALILAVPITTIIASYMALHGNTWKYTIKKYALLVWD